MVEDHIVGPGECIASIAARYGTTVDALWNAADNRELRERRESPHLLMSGDVVRVPSVDIAGTSVSSGGTHSHRAQVSMVTLRLALLDPNLETATREGPPEPVPLRDCAFRLVVGRHVVEGTTDGEGLVEAQVPARATVAQLVLAPNTDDERQLRLSIGYLDPIDERSGALQRLHNLGWKGHPDDERATIEAFQLARGLEPSGELDPTTIDVLRDEAGC